MKSKHLIFNIILFKCLRNIIYFFIQRSHLADYAAYFEELAANEGHVSESASEVMRYQYRHAVATSGDNYKK